MPEQSGFKESNFRKGVAIAIGVLLVRVFIGGWAGLEHRSPNLARHELRGPQNLAKSDPCVASEQENLLGGQRPSLQRCLSWYYQFNPHGMRKWVQVRNDTWDESYPPDPKIRDEFHITGPATIHGVQGVIANKVSMTNFEVFIPDEATAKPFFILMRWTNGHQGWTKLGEVK